MFYLKKIVLEKPQLFGSEEYRRHIDMKKKTKPQTMANARVAINKIKICVNVY